MVEWMAARTIARTRYPALVGALVISGPTFLLGQCSIASHQINNQIAGQVGAIERGGNRPVKVRRRPPAL